MAAPPFAARRAARRDHLLLTPGPSVADENRRYCGTLSNHSIPGQDREVQVSVLAMVVSELTTAASDQSGS